MKSNAIAYNLHAHKFWEVKQNEKKIGILQLTTRGYTFRTENSIEHFTNIGSLKNKYNIVFKNVKTQIDDSNMVYGFSVGKKTYNNLWDVQHKLPLFTYTKKSKSYHCAGFYIINNNVIKQNPKLIYLNRQNYIGPFKSEEHANIHIRSMDQKSS
jgi:hypothetical protein